MGPLNYFPVALCLLLFSLHNGVGCKRLDLALEDINQDTEDSNSDLADVEKDTSTLVDIAGGGTGATAPLLQHPVEIVGTDSNTMGFVDSKEDLNGKKGVAIAWKPDYKPSARYVVRLDDGREFKFKPENLREDASPVVNSVAQPAPLLQHRVEVVGTSREDLNGKKGVAAVWDANAKPAGRYVVRLDDGQEFKFKPENLKEDTALMLTLPGFKNPAVLESCCAKCCLGKCATHTRCINPSSALLAGVAI